MSPRATSEPRDHSVQVTVGGNRVIIHYSLIRRLDDLEDAERATIGTMWEAAGNSGGAR